MLNKFLLYIYIYIKYNTNITNCLLAFEFSLSSLFLYVFITQPVSICPLPPSSGGPFHLFHFQFLGSLPIYKYIDILCGFTFNLQIHRYIFSDFDFGLYTERYLYMGFYISEMDRRRRSLVLLLLGFVFVDELYLGTANVVFEVKHKFGARRERSLRALKAHDSHRHGRMLAAIDLPLGGKGRAGDSSLFYTKIGIGTPSKDYHLQVDTGSDILWVNCAGCKNCPKETKLDINLATYDPNGSSTGEPITCDEDFCTSTFNAPFADCKFGRLCEYSITYGDGSSTTGYFVRDKVHFDSATGDLKTTAMNGSVAFGCGAKQSGELGSSDESVDGIIGFGQANSSILSQLASAGNVKKVFSHCLDARNGGGIFAIGEVVQPKFSSTPLVPDMPHYNVIMKAIEVDGDVLELPTDIFDAGDNRGTIIDSGTTLAYLPDEVLRPLMQKIMARQPGLKTYTLEEQFTCFSYKENVDDGFPVVTFHFENSVSLSVYPHDYLFAVDDEQCVGWMNSGLQTRDGKELTLLGDIALSNKIVVYDLDNQTIGWTDYNCSSSIKVKDEQSGNVYSVGAHNLSAASFSSQSMGKMLTLLLLMAISCTLL